MTGAGFSCCGGGTTHLLFGRQPACTHLNICAPLLNVRCTFWFAKPVVLLRFVSWQHTLHFVAHTQSPGALWWSCGWALRTCTRLPFWYSLLFFLLLLLSLSIAFWVWLWLVLTVIIAELPFPTRPFINKYLDRENSGEGSRPQ